VLGVSQPYSMIPSQSVPTITMNSSGYSTAENPAFAPIEFKFVKDDDFELPRETPLPPMRQPEYESDWMAQADKFDSEVAAHDQKVRDLAAQPLTNQNLEAQIQELLEGQENLRYELKQVKMQVSNNASELEALRRETQGMGMSRPSYSAPAPAPLYQPPLPVPSAMQTGQSVQPEYFSAPPEKPESEALLFNNLGYSGSLFDGLGSTQDHFDALRNHATNLHSNFQGYLPQSWARR